MDIPFIYDRYVTGKNFVGRKAECGILSKLLAKGENISIYEPPKSGKMSLIRQTFFQMRLSGQQFSVCGLDLFNVRTIPEFLVKFGNALIRPSASSPEEYAEIVARYLSGTCFRFDMDRFSENDEAVSADGMAGADDIRAMLLLPYRLAEAKGEPLYLIMEEFQSLLHVEGYETLFKIMEDVMSEKPAGCSFIFSGSGVNAMKYIFEERRYFYRLVEHLPLYPIDEREIAEYLVKGFLHSGKALEKNDAQSICAVFGSNLWYVSHFAAICDTLTRGYVNLSVMMEALNVLISIHEPKFRAIMDSLTGYQISFVRAVLDGVTRFSTAEIIGRYGLNSSANVKRVKDALKKKEVITFDEKDIPSFLDPLFRYWVEKYYFERHLNNLVGN